MPRLIEGHLVSPPGRFALVVSRFNSLITDQLLRGALDTLNRHGVADDAVDVVRVPGTFEIPAVVRRVATSGHYSGVIALGAVIRGGTPHFDYVAGEVSKGVASVAMEVECAVTFGVLTCDTVEQAVDRAGVKAGNKGSEAAVACIETVNLFAQLASADKPRLSARAAKQGA